MGASYLKAHEKENHFEQKISCHFCQNVCQGPDNFILHVNQSHSKELDTCWINCCQSCSSVFPTVKLLRKHEREEHQDIRRANQKKESLQRKQQHRVRQRKQQKFQLVQQKQQQQKLRQNQELQQQHKQQQYEHEPQLIQQQQQQQKLQLFQQQHQQQQNQQQIQQEQKLQQEQEVSKNHQNVDLQTGDDAANETVRSSYELLAEKSAESSSETVKEMLSENSKEISNEKVKELSNEKETSTENNIVNNKKISTEKVNEISNEKVVESWPVKKNNCKFCPLGFQSIRPYHKHANVEHLDLIKGLWHLCQICSIYYSTSETVILILRLT
jgi:hypothetical protein